MQPAESFLAPFPKASQCRQEKKYTCNFFSSPVDIVCRDVAPQWSYKQNKQWQRAILLFLLITAEAEEFLYLQRESCVDWISAVTNTHQNLQLPFSFTLYLEFYETILSHFPQRTSTDCVTQWYSTRQEWGLTLALTLYYLQNVVFLSST